jgi:hypothetical protein
LIGFSTEGLSSVSQHVKKKDKIKKKGFEDICVEGKKKLCALMSRAVDGRTDGGIVMDGKFQRILAVVFLAR